MDIRRAWEDLVYLRKEAEKAGPKYSELFKALIADRKKKIRDYYRTREANSDPYLANVFRIDNDGSRIEKIVAEAGPGEGVEDMENFFMNHYYIEAPHSWYDCTGKAFTSWHRTFKAGNLLICYHGIAIDC